MPFSELFDETLDINSTLNYELSIQASLDGFYFSLFDRLRKKSVLFRSYENEDSRELSALKIEEIISQDDFLKKDYHRKRIIVPSHRSTLIPSQLYDPAGRDEYFALNHPLSDKRQILVSKLFYPDAILLYDCDRDIHNMINERLPETEISHHLKPLLHRILTGKESRDQEGLFLHVESDFITVILTSGAALKLCNSYRYRTVSDILYYLLYIAKMSGYPKERPLYVSGKTERFDDIWTDLSEYIREIKYLLPDSGILFGPYFREELLHRHLNLFSLFSCE